MFFTDSSFPPQTVETTNPQFHLLYSGMLLESHSGQPAKIGFIASMYIYVFRWLFLTALLNLEWYYTEWIDRVYFSSPPLKDILIDFKGLIILKIAVGLES